MIDQGISSFFACVEELATGNLNVRLNQKHLQRKDEVGELTRTIDKLQSDLRSIIGGISDSTGQTKESAKTIREAAGLLSDIEEVEQSELNLKETADVLDQNIRNFQMG